MKRVLSTIVLAAGLAVPVASIAAPMLSIVPVAAAVSGGATTSVDIVLDTDGRSLEGYALSVEFSDDVSGISRTPADLPGLTPDLFFSPTISANLVTNLNQGSFIGSLAPGEYLLETLTFTAVHPGDLQITPFLSAGETLGLGSSTCPGDGCPGAAPTFESGMIEIVPVPEPGTLLLLGTCAVGLVAQRRRI